MLDPTLLDFARASGAAGRSWHDTACGDNVQEWAATVCHRDCRDDVAELERAHAEGFAQHLLASGWVARWTAAPEEFDSFGASTIAQHGVWHGKELRQVVIDPQYLDFQATRYSSGLHGCWESDPRIEEAERDARVARLEADRVARETAREAGLVWLAECSDDELQDAIDAEIDIALHARGLAWQDARNERLHREEMHQAEAREAAFLDARAMVPDGCVLVDEGSYGIVNRPERVHYGIRVLEIGRDANLSLVYSGGNNLGSLAEIASGYYVAVDAANVPPEPVGKRLGTIKSARRYEIDGRVVWVGYPRHTYVLMVLDDRGRLARKRSIVEAALHAYKEERRT
jgi:hypothetical protein